jgi:hypothetical protein
MGNSQSRKPYAATIKDIPYKSYIIQIDLYNMSLARINKLLLLTSSQEWLSLVMSDACEEQFDILIGNITSCDNVKVVSDITYKIKADVNGFDKLFVSWRSVPVDTENLALAIGRRLNVLYNKLKIDLLVRDKISPSSNVLLSHSL